MPMRSLGLDEAFSGDHYASSQGCTICRGGYRANNVVTNEAANGRGKVTQSQDWRYAKSLVVRLRAWWHRRRSRRGTKRRPRLRPLGDRVGTSQRLCQRNEDRGNSNGMLRRATYVPDEAVNRGHQRSATGTENGQRPGQALTPVRQETTF